MKKLFYFLLFVAITANAFAQIPKYMLENSAVGKDFWVAIPPNDPNNGGYWEIEFYIASQFNTTAYVENVNTGDKKTFNIKANGVAIVPFFSGDEVIESEEITNKGWHIYSNDPISVYMLNTRPTTSDGYMALPINVLGREYIHVAHYEFNDFGTQPAFGTGFIITATEDQTNVHFTLKGKGAPATFKNGWPLGTTKDIILQKGQTYMLRTKGNTSNQNDITGTSISSDKPVSVISFHMRANLPSGVVTGSRDCLSEMLPPVQAWGKKFVSLPFATNSDKGDLFRVVASEDNTLIKASVYDKTGRLTKVKETLIHKGDFVEWDNSATLDHVQSINGPTFWESNNPVLVMQYCMSQAYYSNGNYDPDMVVVPPIEQYGNSTVFQTPPGERFATNWFYLYAIGDSTDQTHTKLKTITLDDKNIWKSYPALLQNRIPGTNVHWAIISVVPGEHYITAETELGGIINGFSSVDGYAWPAAMYINKIDQTDTLPPQIKVVENCSKFTVTASESRSYGSTKISQIDQGINGIEVIYSINIRNFKILGYPDGKVPNYPKPTSLDFSFEPTDPESVAQILYLVRDAAGNSTLDTIRYIPQVSMTRKIDFGRVDYNKEVNGIVSITNSSDKPLQLKNIHLLFGTVYSVNSQDTLTVPPGEGAQIGITLKAQKKISLVDSLIIDTECGRLGVQLMASAPNYSFTVNDIVFPATNVGEMHCDSVGMMIVNTGEPVTINSIQGVSSPFSWTGAEPQLPYFLANGDFILLKNFCFSPELSGTYQNNIFIVAEEDTIFAKLKGTAIVSSIEEKFPFGEIFVSDNILRIFSSEHSGELSVEIFTLLGEKIYAEKILFDDGRVELLLPIQHSGVYYAKISSGRNSFIHKIIIAR